MIRRTRSAMAAVVSIGTLIFGATGVFVQLKAALNTVWGVADQVREAADRRGAPALGQGAPRISAEYCFLISFIASLP